MAKKDDKNKIDIEKTKCDNEACCCDDCNCDGDCNCSQDDSCCDCGGECHCGENCECEISNDEQHEQKDLTKDFIDTIQRIQAEFDNYRKRTQMELATVRTDGKIDAVKKFLPALDTMKKAREMVGDNKDIVMGIDMVIRQLDNSLKEIGVEKVDVVGKPFDPKYSNVIAVNMDSTVEDGIVLEEMQSGYKLNDKIIRYANVLVNKLN